MILQDLEMLNSQIWEYIFANLGMFPRFQNYSHFRPWYPTVTVLSTGFEA